ncbi:hypothetical protein D3C76_1073140 [compost metagenome]
MVGLAERADHEGALIQLFMIQHADVGHAIKHQMFIDFVADHVDVAIADQGCQLVEFGTADQCATGVVRGVEDDHPRARAQCLGKLLEVDTEIVQAQLYVHATTAGQLYRGLVAVVGRVKHDDFVAAVDNRLNGTENRLGRAWGDRHFSIRIHLRAIAAGDLHRNLLTQHRQAGHRRILVVATGDMPADRIAQGLRGREIGKTLGQIERAGLSRELRHLSEDSDADIRQLTGDHRWFPALHPALRRRGGVRG